MQAARRRVPTARAARVAKCFLMGLGVVFGGGLGEVEAFGVVVAGGDGEGL